MSQQPVSYAASGVDINRQDEALRRIKPLVKATRTEGVRPGEAWRARQYDIRLKRNTRLYIDNPFGVAFTGKSIFRASIVLPANVPVGPFETRVYLFRQETFLSKFSVRHTLEREGLERYLHSFANRLPTLYGIVTVIIAVGAGLAASAIFRRTRLES